jgi:predicted amidohydrolase YtcJ
MQFCPILLRLLALTTACLLSLPQSLAAQEPADAVYLGGKVYTVDADFSVAEAVAVRGDRFVYVGTDEGARGYIGPRTAVSDLAGKPVLPGLIDTHLHWRDDLEPRLLAVGLTSIHDLGKADMAKVERLTRLYEAGELKIRLNVMLHTATAFEMGEPRTGLFGHRLSFRGTKVHADNELGPRRASLFEEYDDRPGFYGPWGKHRLRPELGEGDQEVQYAMTVARLIELGFQPRTHAIGDDTNHVVLNAYERAFPLPISKGCSQISLKQKGRREPAACQKIFDRDGMAAAVVGVGD